MSNVDDLYNAYSQNAQTAKLIGILDALEKRLTYTNDLLVQLVGVLLEDQTKNTSRPADIATPKSQTAPSWPIIEDSSNDHGSNNG